jgi:tetratricopeptide (TPR) repeat protein
MAQAALADLEARRGATQAALALADRAAESVPGHPALARIRADALAHAWRLDEAATSLRDAALASVHDDATWSHLAVLFGSGGRAGEALTAAERALALQPRDPDALRVQALALARLGAPHAAQERAEHAYVERRLPDEAPALRAACSRNVPNCALERLPVHVHTMRTRVQ